MDTKYIGYAEAVEFFHRAEQEEITDDQALELLEEAGQTQWQAKYGMSLLSELREALLRNPDLGSYMVDYLAKHSDDITCEVLAAEHWNADGETFMTLTQIWGRDISENTAGYFRLITERYDADEIITETIVDIWEDEIGKDYTADAAEVMLDIVDHPETTGELLERIYTIWNHARIEAEDNPYRRQNSQSIRGAERITALIIEQPQASAELIKRIERDKKNREERRAYELAA